MAPQTRHSDSHPEFSLRLGRGPRGNSLAASMIRMASSSVYRFLGVTPDILAYQNAVVTQVVLSSCMLICMNPNAQRTQPLVFTPDDRDEPARLVYPDDGDVSLITSQFPPGFFTYSESAGCAFFDAVRSTDVIQALLIDWPYVDVTTGPFITRPTRSTTIKRPAGVRPRGAMSYGPAIPMAA